MHQRVFAIALVALLARVAYTQVIEANPSGSGYRLRLPNTSPVPVKYDLDTLSLWCESRGWDLLKLSEDESVFPWRGKGVVVIPPGTGPVADQVTLPLPKLPKQLLGATKIGMRCLVQYGDLWQSSRTDLPCAIPSSPVAPPSDQPGQFFIILPGQEFPTLTNSAGAALPESRCVLRVLTFISKEKGLVRKNRFVFQLDGTTEKVHIESDSALLEQPGLEPVVKELIQGAPPRSGPTDGNEARYTAGAWIYGSTLWLTNPRESVTTPFDTRNGKINVKGIYRLWRSSHAEISTAGGGFGGSSDAGDWPALHPLLVVLESPAGKIVEKGVRVFTGEVRDMQAAAKKERERERDLSQYVDPFLILVDDWHVYRQLSSWPPSHDFADAPPRIKRAFARGEWATGMSYDQFAWVRGWPMLPAYPGAIVAAKLDYWTYPAPVFTDNAIFKNGKFLDYSQYKLP